MYKSTLGISVAAVVSWGVLVGVTGCRPGQVVSLQTLPNYVPDQPTVLFLDLIVNGQADDPARAKVRLANAIAGRGSMKAMPLYSHSDRQIEAVLMDATNQPIRTYQYDHPLYKVVEYPTDSTGAMRLRGVGLPQAYLSIRFQTDPAISRLDLYSLYKNRRRKLYSLRLKP
jgi:hypothetical protein